MTALQRVLDPCCGSRMLWFDKQHPDALFGKNGINPIVFARAVEAAMGVGKAE